MTIGDIDTVTLTIPNANKVIGAKNFNNVGTINIVDAAANDNGSDNIKVTNVASGQAVAINSDAALYGDWDGDKVTVDLATGVTALDVTLKGLVALEGTGVLATDATTLTVTDSIKGSDGYFESETLVLEGLSSDAKLTTLNLAGGGSTSATATGTFTASGTTNVNLSTLDATALSSHLNIAGITTDTGASIKLGAGDNRLPVAIADAVRDALNIDGGDGTDTVIFENIEDDVIRVGVTNVETIDVDMAATMGGNGEMSLEVTLLLSPQLSSTSTLTIGTSLSPERIRSLLTKLRQHQLLLVQTPSPLVLLPLDNYQRCSNWRYSWLFRA